MNFLNSDFDHDGASPATIREFRDFYMSSPNKHDNSSAERAPLLEQSFDEHSELNGKAGALGTLFWNTAVLSERTAINYSRNLLAYGVRIGMYAGVLSNSG